MSINFFLLGYILSALFITKSNYELNLYVVLALVIVSCIVDVVKLIKNNK